MMKFNQKKLLIIVMSLIFILAASPVFGAPGNSRVFVEFAPSGKAAVQTAISAAGGEFHYTFDQLNTFVVSLPSNAVSSLSSNPNVLDIEADPHRYPVGVAASKPQALLADTTGPNGQTIPYGIDTVQARDVWDADRNGAIDPGVAAGAGVTVCVIDSGYDAIHEDLSGINDVGGYSGKSSPNIPPLIYTEDGLGHGSHVTGTIAAVNNNLGVVGVAPNVSLYFVKVFNEFGEWAYSSDLIDAANKCAQNGANIINMSLRGPSSSKKEERVFADLEQSGVISIAASGNDGEFDNSFSYPASYSSVISVGGVDESLNAAVFSQKNSQVEIAAPAVDVLSTVPFAIFGKLTVGGVTYDSNVLEGSAEGLVSGTLVDGGLCDSTGSFNGQVVLCERGLISFYEKVINVQNGGGAAAVIYNNEPGNFYGTFSGNLSLIPAISISQADGQFLVGNQIGALANVESVSQSDTYARYDGTSMAVPHVSGVAALLWSQYPDATNEEIRQAMTSTALDLGAAGRDSTFGFGVVQAAAALDFLDGGGGTGGAQMAVSVSTGATFTKGDKAQITVTVMDEAGVFVSGANVDLTIQTPKGKTHTDTGVTDASGQVNFTFRINLKKYGTGQYFVEAVATHSSYTPATGSATFQAE